MKLDDATPDTKLETSVRGLSLRQSEGATPAALVQRTGQWARFTEAERKRRAAEAANTRDLETLWGLTEAHLTLYGGSGARVSGNTLQAYRRGVQVLLESWSGENLLRPSNDAGALWLRGLEAQGLSASTLRVRLAAAKALYRALRWANATDAVPFADARAGKDRTAAHDKRQPYSEQDLVRLLEHAEGQDKLLVLLGSYAGLRVSEIVRLEWRDVDFSSKKLTVRQGKGNKTRRVTLSKTLLQALWEGRGSGGVLNVSSRSRAYRRLKNLCLVAGVEFRGVHALRHYTGTRVYRETRDLNEVAHVLGHASIETTRVYAAYDKAVKKDAVSDW